MLDARLGRWFSPDLMEQPWQSTYASMDNNPVALNDVLGLSTGGDDNTVYGGESDDKLDNIKYERSDNGDHDSKNGKIGDFLSQIGGAVLELATLLEKVNGAEMNKASTSLLDYQPLYKSEVMKFLKENHLCPIVVTLVGNGNNSQEMKWKEELKLG